jgi:hypothetical protein
MTEPRGESYAETIRKAVQRMREEIEAEIFKVPAVPPASTLTLEEVKRSLAAFAHQMYDDGPAKISPWQFEFLEGRVATPVFRGRYYYGPNVIAPLRFNPFLMGAIGAGDERPRPPARNRIPRKTKKAIRKRRPGGWPPRLRPRERARVNRWLTWRDR